MIIKRLSLHNFGIYAGDNTYVFTHNKPIELIGGMNGRGKTTFLNAILISLYGQNSFAYKESDYLSYGQYLKAHVNAGDGTNETFVEIEFTMDHEDNSVYVIRRSWDGNMKRVSENLSVSKNNEFNKFLTDNWDMYIENIIPSALSKFFFFDGEQIADIVRKNNTSQIKASIRALLGIDVIDTLEKDLRRVNRKVKKTVGAVLDHEEADRLEKAKDDAAAALEEQDKKIAQKKEELENTGRLLEEANVRYRTLGGDSVEKREENHKKRADLINEIRTENNQLMEQAAGALPFELVRDLVTDVENQVLKENQSKKDAAALVRIKELANGYLAGKHVSEDMSSFLDYVNATAESSKVNIIYGFSSSAEYLVKQLNDSLLKQSVTETSALMNRRDENQIKVNEIDNYLSLDIDEDAVKKQFAAIKTLEVKQAGLEAEIRQLEIDRQGLHGNQLKKEAEFNKFVGQALDKLETSDDSERILKYLDLMNEVFDKYKIRLQKEKLDHLADTISDCYRRLRNKNNLIDHIVIDHDTLEFSYFNSKDQLINHAVLSAGEKQMVIVCVLWGLAICSKRNLPVIIDTPLGRMDSDNRDSLVEKYFPNASEQVIILSTDTEIDQKYYRMMKKNISDEYLIVFDDEKNSSHIEKGYFFGDEA